MVKKRSETVANEHGAGGKPPEAAPKDTVATRNVYDQFFGLYARYIRDSNFCPLSRVQKQDAKGVCFIPLGFIPGPAIIIVARVGKASLVAATPDVADVDESDEKWAMVEKVVQQWLEMTQKLGHDLSPWNLGFAQRMLEGQPPDRYLCMGLIRFRLGPGQPEVAFGVTLLPEAGNAMKVGKVFNPTKMAGCPAEGEVLSIAELKEGKGPVQKLLRTWALMETNFLGRYDREGRPRQNRNHARGDRKDRYNTSRLLFR